MIVEFQSKCAKYRERAILDAIFLAKDELMPRVRKLFINIRPIRNLTEKKGIHGDCMDEDDREFTIRLDISLPLDDMITTVLHEMVHVKQYLYNEEMDRSLPYIERPYEIEAHAVEQQLKVKYDKRNR